MAGFIDAFQRDIMWGAAAGGPTETTIHPISARERPGLTRSYL
jgi:hypothetical protein